MRRIESTQNPKIKSVRRITSRKVPELWILEGIKLVAEALEAQVQIEEIYVTSDFIEKEAQRMEVIENRKIPLFHVSQNLMKQISGVETPPGILAVARMMPKVVRSVPQKFAALLISIRDPGNFGTILRVAEAAGCDYVAYTADCVDPYLPKTVRASTGSILRMPLVEISDVAEFLKENESHDVSIYALDAHEGTNVFRQKPRLPALLLIGSESHGLPSNIVESTLRLRIPMEGNVESLNAALAAGICFYWFANSSGFK